MTIDEAAIRRLLDHLDEAPEPPSTVGIGQALAAGRRKLRWLRIGGTGTTLLAVTSVAATAVLTAGPAAHRGHPAGPVARRGHPAGPRARRAPRSFNPLVPYATFTLLDQSPSSSEELVIATTDTGVVNEVGANFQPPFTLLVASAGRCLLAGPYRYRYSPAQGGPVRSAHAFQSLRCSFPYIGPRRYPLTAKAGKWMGKAAEYWVGVPGYALAWQYAAGGWAILTATAVIPAYTPGAPTQEPGASARTNQESLRTRLELFSQYVRFGARAPLTFPFRLDRLPLGWGVREAIVRQSGRPSWSELVLGPRGGRSAALALTWYRAGPAPAPACPASSRGAQPVRLAAGVTGYLTSTASPAGQHQVLCVPNVGGTKLLIISVNQYTGSDPSGAFVFSTAFGVFADLRFPPGGTTHPLG
jgi:hypothetical protein